MTAFGRDTSCTDALRSGRFVSGARLVAEAIYRRLITPRGMLRGGEGEADYGLDLMGLIGRTTSAADRAALPGVVAAEVRKDERVDTVDVRVTSTVHGPTTAYDVAISCTTAAGPFELVVRVSDLTIQMVGFRGDQ